MITQLLEQHLNALYIYASKEEVKAFMPKNLNIQIRNRIIYKGFVEPIPFCNTIDILADTFPFGSGLVGMYALANKCGVVTLKTDEAILSSWYGNLGSFVSSNTEDLAQ